ncbi:MurR/RpiR family transcriptional regulator [Nocardia sp. alder85J]|uniref:MurR/RpiR family transcriptional regulator n=1 Tax=Nocardia sp. alder85J TaxID=2862949 RepID=UPI001CD3C3BA|nr:MurR/RpiR family transcriptional regulator [Nocardia sp. alder85J]MCX4094085.1 MurR/RpiR family transcriptional regulator [Nocardia sp. alder85J]
MSITPTTPPVGGTLSVIRSLLPSLVPSEQRVAVQFLEHADEVALLSAADVAARANTSPATVIRTCKNLGFKGFQHLRLLLIRDTGAARTAGNSSLDAADSRDWAPAHFDAAVQNMSDALGALDYSEFDRAAAAIAQARRVLVVGNGGSSPAAQAFALLLIIAGRGSEAPADSVTQQLSARTLGPGDVLVAVSSSGQNAVTMDAVTAARGTGATIVGVTGYARSRLRENSDLLLVAGSGETITESYIIASGMAVQVLFLSVLNTAVTRKMGTERRQHVMDQVLNLVGEEPQSTTDAH